MEKRDFIGKQETRQLFDELQILNSDLNRSFRTQYNRSLPFIDGLFDRWERAKVLGFGNGTSIYESAFVFGEVTIGENCWIGPFTILDGSGKLTVGNNCTISAGVHIYSHDNLMATLSSGHVPIERQPVSIGNNVYIAPNVVISKGVCIGDFCVIGAMSFVNQDIPSYSIVVGQPGRIIGTVEVAEGNIQLKYNKK